MEEPPDLEVFKITILQAVIPRGTHTHTPRLKNNSALCTEMTCVQLGKEGSFWRLPAMTDPELPMTHMLPYPDTPCKASMNLCPG